MTPNYNIKGTGVAVSDEIRTYVEKRLLHVQKFLHADSTTHVDVELEFRASEEGKKYRVELTLSVDSSVYRAEARGEVLHEAIDIASNELSTEVGRANKKRLRLVRRGAARFKEFVRGFRRKI